MMERDCVDDRDGLVQTDPPVDMDYLLSGAPALYERPTSEERPDVEDDEIDLDDLELEQ